MISASAAFLIVMLVSHDASAGGKLEDVISGLYGGNGITLQDPPGGHAAQFTSPDGGEFNAIGSAIASGVNLGAAGAVVTSFTFDPAQAVFVRSDEGLGSMVADLADTIGQGNISFGTSYTRFDFKSFQGEDLNSLEVEFAHADLCGSGSAFPGQLPSAANGFCGPVDPQPTPSNPNFEVDSLSAVLNIKLRQEVFAVFANYGILDNWDVGIVIPFVHTDISVSSESAINRVFGNSLGVHNFCTSLDGAGGPGCGDGTKDLSTDFRSEDAWGIGDVELRSKFQFLDDHAWAPDTAVLGRVRFASGDEKDFLGAGFTSFAGALILSKTIAIFTPHANVGIELTTGPGSFDNVRWVAGSTAKIHERVTVAVDFMGRHALEDDGIGDDILEFATSLKINPFSSFNLIANAVLPLNYNQGLRTAVTWGVGFEHTF